MARHLTWCLKRTFVLTTHFHAHLQSRFVAITNQSVVQKGHLAATRVNKLSYDVQEGQEGYRDLEMFMEDAKHGTTHAISALMKLLCISEENASRAVQDYPAFKAQQKKIIYENFQILRERGMFKSTIKDNKFLLIGTPQDLKSKIQCVESFGVDINNAAALFQLPLMVLKTSSLYTKIDATYLPARNKLYYLAEKLKCDISKICHAVSYSPYILTMPPPKLMTITELALAAGIAPEHIISDMMLYKYPLSTVKEKLAQANALGIHPLKPWIVRCGDRPWEIARQRFAQRAALFKPHMTREELICEVFECDPDIAKCILKRSHRIMKMELEKFYNNIRLIKAQGYSAEEFMMSTLTVHRSTRTLEKLFEMWNESGLPKGRLCLFSKPTECVQQVISERCAELQNGHET